jgi:hypothetical protein
MKRRGLRPDLVPSQLPQRRLRPGKKACPDRPGGAASAAAPALASGLARPKAMCELTEFANKLGIGGPADRHGGLAQMEKVDG